jgi:hypothetical protein
MFRFSRRTERRITSVAALSRDVTYSVTDAGDARSPISGLGYNERVPKRICTSRAEWRLQPGKPDAPISAHYRLDCDYGTGVITCWEEGGSEPIYVCESHAKQLARPRKQVTDIRIITPQPDHTDTLLESLEPTRIEEAAAPALQVSDPPNVSARPEISAPPEAAPENAPCPSTDGVAAVRQDEPDVTPKTAEDQMPIQEIAALRPEPTPPPEPPRTVSSAKPARPADPPARSPARDLAFGNPAKAIVDESIWNLPPGNHQAYKAARQQGKSAAEAAEAAGGQLAMVHRKINEYAAKVENILSESKTTISAGETIDKPLEQAVLEVIGNAAMSDAEKDAAVQQLGTLQEWAKHGLQGNITPMQANQILLAIGGRLNWGAAADVPEQFKPVYRGLFANLKAAIRVAVPEAQNLHNRLTNLYAAKSDLEIR